eukprot:TRINITY_DN95428_c0_g1_i1.p2 TRINITY_DN95428_c0_g1~~TRINITY_DN95428_c0_g1_i1.p2  ORF type:complete len:233 (+),score=-23.16 TRINITY_DN95428_c0_g1_i1:34-699(+)
MCSKDYDFLFLEQLLGHVEFLRPLVLRNFSLLQDDENTRRCVYLFIATNSNSSYELWCFCLLYIVQYPQTISLSTKERDFPNQNYYLLGCLSQNQSIGQILISLLFLHFSVSLIAQFLHGLNKVFKKFHQYRVFHRVNAHNFLCDSKRNIRVVILINNTTQQVGQDYLILVFLENYTRIIPYLTYLNNIFNCTIFTRLKQSIQKVSLIQSLPSSQCPQFFV